MFRSLLLLLTALFWEAAFSEENPDEPTVHDLSVTKEKTHEVTDELVDIVERLAVKEPDISLRSGGRPKRELRGDVTLDFYSSGGHRKDSK